jgi:transcription termination factor Rho
VESERSNARPGAVAPGGNNSAGERRDWRKPERKRGHGRRGGRRRRRAGEGGEHEAAAGAEVTEPGSAPEGAAAPRRAPRGSAGRGERPLEAEAPRGGEGDDRDAGAAGEGPADGADERAPRAADGPEGGGRGRRRRRGRRSGGGAANEGAAGAAPQSVDEPPTDDDSDSGERDGFEGVYADGYDEDIEYASTRDARPAPSGDGSAGARADGGAPNQEGGDEFRGRGRRRRRRGRRGRDERFDGQQQGPRDGGPQGARPGAAVAAPRAQAHDGGAHHARGPHDQGAGHERARPNDKGGITSGVLITDKGGHGKLRSAERGWHGDRKGDVHVSPKWIQKHHLREGMLIECRYGRGMGKHQWDITELISIDGEPAAEARKVPDFRKLTSIDPDFHYEVGDFTKDTSLRVVDIICPIGRGQRGLIVAPPRSGKTVLMKKFANAIEEHYPDVVLMVLLVDERPEEATDWQRSTKGEVFVSTNDEMPKTHVEVAEVVWKRAMRLVELGKDVIVLLDSITRLARAYNHVAGNSGKTMSGGLDTRAMERPKQFFGSARNTETAGSLTIIGTCLVETGSKMDQVIFEEFKGTGNMELVLSRKLADRRIFPAIDVERSGTRKEEKLLSAQRLRRVHTLRRVLSRMHFVEAMELLITRLDDVERNDDFLKRFDIDPEA